MGVGAIFISSLAMHRLPEAPPNPSSQPELLSAMLEPIVSFVVLGSIIIRTQPYFTFAWANIRQMGYPYHSSIWEFRSDGVYPLRLLRLELGCGQIGFWTSVGWNPCRSKTPQL